MSIKSPCVKCDDRDNTNGLFTCNGCHAHFCNNHIIDHINELRNRFEEVINEYNLVKDIFEKYKNQWRDTKWELIRKYEREFHHIKCEIDQCQKTSNYSEQELDQWMRQLNTVNSQLTKTDELPSGSSSKRFPICLGSIPITLLICYLIILFFPATSFTKIDGPITLSYSKQTATHTGLDFVPGSVRLNRDYGKGVHHVQLSYEQLSSSSKTFIGITSEQSISSSPYGWLIGDMDVIYQQPDELSIFQTLRKWRSFFTSPSRRHIQPGDILDLELNCVNSTITLKNLQTNRKYELDIALEQSPLPWQIILHFDRHGDRVDLR